MNIFSKIKKFFIPLTLKREKSEEDTTMPQTHLENYLEYYLSLENPGFAVLVKGPWGTGKTFQVKKYIPEENCYYVSLFGLDSIEQLHTEVYAAAFPMQGKAEKLAQVSSEIGEKVGGIFELAKYAPSLVTTIFRRELKNDRALIFDDLERSTLKAKDLFGAINFYIEQKGFKVIIIAHDEKLMKKFGEMKEKLFGQEIAIVPMVEEAFNIFVNSIPDDNAKKFINTHRSIIKDIFDRSEEKSLRILKHVIEDLSRVFKILDKKYIANKDAMHIFLSLFSIFDIETRNNKLNKNDLKLRNKIHSSYLFNAETKAPNIFQIGKKYPSITITDQILSDELSISFFIDGCYNQSILQESLDNSVYFLKPEDAAPWKVVIHFDDMESDVVEKNLKIMERQFVNREISEHGELLHFFSLFLMMADEGIINKSLDEVHLECSNYIDDVKKNKLLKPYNPYTISHDDISSSYDGICYWITEASKPHFEQLYKKLQDARMAVFKQTIPSIANDILKLLTDDPESLIHKISYTHTAGNLYANVPALCEIDPNQFVTSWLSLQHKEWKHIKYALENRYNNHKLYSELKEEMPWAKEVYKLLVAAADANTGFDALRIRRIVPGIFSQEFGNISDVTDEGQKAELSLQ